MKWTWFFVYLMVPPLFFPAISGGLGKDAEDGAYLFARIVFPAVIAFMVYLGIEYSRQ